MRFLKFNLIVSLFIAFMSLTSFSSGNEAKKVVRGNTINNIEEGDVYWFTVSVKLDDRTDQYKIMGAASKLSKGLVSEFEKDVWYGISRRQIIVGPFQTQNEGLNARMLYKKDEDKINNIPSEDNPEQVYWFFVTFVQLERLGSYVFERMPAAVASGSTTEFVDALYEGITFKTLAIGPFWDQPNAENAKSLYRENE
jgi:hypothetical protein